MRGWLAKLAVAPVLLYRRIRFGYPFRRIPLTQGKYAIVDPDDYERLTKYKWYAANNSGSFYALRGKWCGTVKKRSKSISMHRQIINAPNSLYVDHINHNTLDNRKANLRPATPAENARNAYYPKKNATSKFRGVWFNKQTNKWRSQIMVDRKKPANNRNG